MNGGYRDCRVFYFFMDSGIYKIYWTNCQYFYFGQAVDLEKRKKQHLSRLKFNNHDNYKLQQVYNKYGIPIFFIIEKCHIEDLDKKEEKIIVENFNNNYCCNLVSCVKGSRGRIITDELRKKLSDARINLSPESRKNISEAQKGKVSTVEANNKRRKFMLNVSVEYKENMRRIKTGTYTGSDNHSSKVVLDTSTGVFYDCLKQASNYYFYKYGYLKMMLSGRSKNKTNLIYC